MQNQISTQEFSILHTYFRDLLVIHNDDNKLKYCFSKVYVREFDNTAIAAYAFSLPNVSFLEQNELFKEFVIEKLPLFSSRQNIDPILLYAHIGQGKTTYLKHLINIRIINDAVFADIKDKVKFIYLPLTDDDDECKNLRKDFLRDLVKIFTQLLKDLNIIEDIEQLREVFPEQYAHYSRIDNNNPAKFQNFIIEKLGFKSYVREWIKWICEKHHIKICCIFDNIDQHFPLISDHKIFHKAFQFIRSFFVQLIIPLRTSNKGFFEKAYFDAFHPIPVTLGLPNFGDLIVKRLRYIKHHFVSELKSPIIKFEDGKTITTSELFTKFEKIASYINDYEQIKSSLEMISNYNSRSFLKITTNIFSSRSLFFHPLTGQEINFVERVNSLKFHSLFIYSLMLQNNDIYYEEGNKTPIANLFNNNLPNNWNSFLKLHILLFLDNLDNRVIHFSEFIELFQVQYRIEKEAIKKAILTLLNKKCCSYMTSNHMEVDDFADLLESEGFYLSIAPRGKYHLILINEIEYYEVLAIPRLFKSKRDLRKLNETRMNERAENLKGFLNFLLEEEKHVKTLIPDENKLDDYLFWSKSIYPKLMNDYNRIFVETKSENNPG